MDESVNTFGSVFLTTIWIFLLFAFILVLFYIFSDIFRDHSMSGWAKAIWIVFLILFPPITSLVYLIARGKGCRNAHWSRPRRRRRRRPNTSSRSLGPTPPIRSPGQAAARPGRHRPGRIRAPEGQGPRQRLTCPTASAASAEPSAGAALRRSRAEPPPS